MSYEDPDFNIRREFYAGNAGGAGTTEYGKFRSFMKARLKEVHFIVTTAGTSTAHGFDVYHGTDSVAAVVIGTRTGNSVVHSAVLDHSMDAMSQVSVKSLADVVGKADVVYEYEVTVDAVKS